LSIIEKLLSTILINCDNQTVIVKVDSSKDNIKSKYTSKTVKVCQKNEKLESYYIGLHPNREEPKQSVYQGAVK
jgi:hypothetical protein